jgi:hypothetical protein
MRIVIKYCPELNIYTLTTGLKTQTLAIDQVPQQLKPLFEQARQIVESGQAIAGLHVEVE